MKFWIIAMKDVTLRLRDRRGLISLFLMPLVLTLILGSALGGVFNDEAVSMPKMTIAVYNGDDQNIGKLIVKDVLQSGDLKPFVTEKVVDSAAKVRETVAAGQADVGLIIPDFYSTHMYSINPVQMQVVQDPGKATAASIVQSIAQSFTDRMATDMGAASQANDDVGKAALEFSNPFDPKIVSEQLFSDTDRVFWHPDVAVIEQPIGEKPVSGKQYYAAAMAVMFLLFNATIGAKMILNERDTETLARMMSTPTSKLSILLGKFIGTVLFAILQFAALLLATRFGFGVSWGNDLGQIAAIAIGYAIAVSGLSMAVASVVASAQNADMVSQIAVQVLSILGGSMVPLSVFPDVMRKIALFTPNAWALNSLTDIMTGTTWQALLTPLTVLISIGVVALLVGTWRLQVARRL